MQKFLAPALAVSAALGLSACAHMAPAPTFSQAALPDTVKVPAGHKVAMETVGVGEITYECRAKANTPGAFEWAFVGPKADLNSRAGAKLGSYYGPPATWVPVILEPSFATQLAGGPK